MLDNEIIDLIVYLNSDGTLFAYNKDNTLNVLYTDLTSWSSLHRIYELNIMPNAKRKGINKDMNLKYVHYYFKEIITETSVRISLEHISKLVKSIVPV